MVTDNPQIDYGRLGRACDFYRDRGWEYVEANWVVPKSVSDITCPPGAREFSLENQGILVGSSEQALIELNLLGKLPRGRYHACSPCFRHEHFITDTHRLFFMKVELHRTDDVSERALREMIEECAEFFISENAVPDLLKTSDGFDLMLNGFEIGSYGIRHHKNISWIYGTGLAEPRFGYAHDRALGNIGADSSELRQAIPA